MSEREEVLRRWREAEDRLYPVVTVRTDLYEAVIGIVRSLADHLQGVPDLDALVTSYLASTPAADLAAAGIERDSLPPEIDAAMARDAAYQLRSRELAQRASSERAQRAIERARRVGDPVVTVWSQGENELWPPYRRVDMSLATGFAVSISTELDPDTMAPMFVLEGLQLDPETGDVAGDGTVAPRREFTDPDAWRAAAADLRQAMLTP
jgi:hypothetical protein